MNTIPKQKVNEMIETTSNEVWMEVLSEVDNSCTLFFNYNNEWYTTSRKLENVYQVPLNTLKTLARRKHSDFAQDGMIAETPNNLLEQVSSCNLLIKQTTDKVNLFTPKSVARILFSLTQNEFADKFVNHVMHEFEIMKTEEINKEKKKQNKKKNEVKPISFRLNKEEREKFEQLAEKQKTTVSRLASQLIKTELTKHGYLNDENDDLVELHIKDVLNENLSDKEYEQIQKISDDEKVSIKEAYEIYKMIQN